MCPPPRASAWPPRPGPSSQSQRNTPLPPPFPAALAAPPRPPSQLLFTSPPRLLGPFCTVICPGETQLTPEWGRPKRSVPQAELHTAGRERKTDWAENRASPPPAAELQGLWAPPFRRMEAFGMSGGLVRVPLRLRMRDCLLRVPPWFSNNKSQPASKLGIPDQTWGSR